VLPLLGGFAAVSGRVSLDSVIAAIGEKFSGKVAAGNAAAAREAYDIVRREMAEAREAAEHA
jgi:pyruvate ferredoxin oxidoreductase gamma subunit